MKTSIFRTLAMLASVSAVLASCTKPEPEPEPEPEPVELSFDIQVRRAGATDATIMITPSADTVGYYAGLIAADEYTYDSSILERDKAALEAIAEEQGITLAEAIGNALLQGPQELDFKDLMSGTAYYVYAYQLDSDFTAGEITKKDFTTGVDFTIELKELSAASITVLVRPQDKEKEYYLNVVPRDQVDGYASEEEFFKGFIEANKPMMKFFINKGDIDLKWDTLYPETEYYAIVFGINSNTMTPTTGLYKEGFETPAFTGSFSVTLDIRELTSASASGNTKPSIKMAKYTRGIVTKTYFDLNGGDRQFIQQQIDSTIQARMDKYGKTKEEVMADYAVTGDAPFIYNELLEDTEYVIWAAPVNSSATIIMEPASATFRTKSSSKAEGSIQLEYVTYYDGNDYYDDFGIKALNYKEKFILHLKIHGKTEDIVHWRLRICGGDLSDKSEQELLGLVLGGRKDPSYDKYVAMYEPWSLVEEAGNKCTILLVGLDSEDRPTDIVSETFDITREGASDINGFYELKGITPPEK